MVNGDFKFYNPLAFLGVVFLAILLNVFLFGVLVQQFYSYWVGGFKDRTRIKAFVIVQFCFATLQCVMLVHLAWNLFVIGYCQATNFKSYTWQAPVSSVCQCVLVLMANTLLACRIYYLTGSRLQSGLVIVLSATAFVFGVCATILPWTSKVSIFIYTDFKNTAEYALTVIWHALQATSEIFLSAFLIRALLNSRFRSKKSDSVVLYLMRRVIQIGLFATIWSLAGAATWFLLPKYTIYALFTVTVGPIYTHMIFDTLLSRTRLRERMNEETVFQIGFRSQLRSGESQAQQESLQIPNRNMLTMAMPQMASSTADTPTLGHVTEDDVTVSELAFMPVGQPGVRYEVPYTPHDEV